MMTTSHTCDIWPWPPVLMLEGARGRVMPRSTRLTTALLAPVSRLTTLALTQPPPCLLANTGWPTLSWLSWGPGPASSWSSTERRYLSTTWTQRTWTAQSQLQLGSPGRFEDQLAQKLWPAHALFPRSWPECQMALHSGWVPLWMVIKVAFLKWNILQNIAKVSQKKW